MKQHELWLIWRSMGKDGNRRRYRVGTLTWDEEKDFYTFKYDHDHDFDIAKEAGFAFFPGFDEDKEYTSEKMFSNIFSRLPKPERDDYLDVLNRYGLNIDDDLFKVLTVTKGRQVTDNFEFVPEFNSEKIEFDVAGIDHREEIEIRECVEDGYLVDGAKLLLELDSENQYDEFAIKVLLPLRDKKILLGYVPRYYSKELTDILRTGIKYSAVVARVNFNAQISDEKVTVRIRLMIEQ